MHPDYYREVTATQLALDIKLIRNSKSCRSGAKPHDVGSSFPVIGYICQGNHCGAPSSGLRGCVAIVNNIRSALKYRADYLSLDSNSFSMDDTHPSCFSPARLIEIVLHDSSNLFRRNRVEIEHIPKFYDDDIGKRILEAGRVVFICV